jgi:PKHD-type hydroxylase
VSPDRRPGAGGRPGTLPAHAEHAEQAEDAEGPPPWASFVVHPGCFTHEECDRLVEIGEAALGPDGAAEARIEGLEAPGDLRMSRVGWVDPHGEARWAVERLLAVAAAANQRWRLDVDGLEEDLQYTLYDRPGSHYTWHHDGLEAGVEDRKVSLVVQLTDPAEYEGGDLEFLEVATDYSPGEREAYLAQARARGTVVSFCSFEYHRVTPLVRGTRRSLVAWLSGPPLR